MKREKTESVSQKMGVSHSDDCRDTYRVFVEAKRALTLAQGACRLCSVKALARRGAL